MKKKKKNLAVRSYGPDTDFQYMCTVTFTSEVWPWVKVMTHPWVMDNNCVKYYPVPTWQWGVMARTRISSMCKLWPWPWRYDLGSRSWHTLGSWTTIMWNYIQIGHRSTKLWPRHDVNRRTDRVIPIYPPNFVFWGINIMAAFRGMHVSPAKHSYAWLPRKCDYRTGGLTDGQTGAEQSDLYMPLCFADVAKTDTVNEGPIGGK